MWKIKENRIKKGMKWKWKEILSMHIRDGTGCEKSKNHQITESGKKSFLEFGINSDQLHPY
jgi:hypothetical protein